MRHFRNVNEIVEVLVAEHQKQGFTVYSTEQGFMVPIPRDVGMAEHEIMAINLTVMANAIWEKYS